MFNFNSRTLLIKHFLMFTDLVSDDFLVQVSARAIEVHGSSDQIEKEKNKKLEKREKIQQKKFEKNIKGWFST